MPGKDLEAKSLHSVEAFVILLEIGEDAVRYECSAFRYAEVVVEGDVVSSNEIYVFVCSDGDSLAPRRVSRHQHHLYARGQLRISVD